MLSRASAPSVLRLLLRPGLRGMCSDQGFASLGLRSEIVEATEKLGYTIPSPIQTLAIAKLTAGESVALASSTGSGKTLAYLLPMFNQLKEQEEASPETRADIRPRAIVLVQCKKTPVQTADTRAYSRANSDLRRPRAISSTRSLAWPSPLRITAACASGHSLLASRCRPCLCHSRVNPKTRTTSFPTHSLEYSLRSR